MLPAMLPKIRGTTFTRSEKHGTSEVLRLRNKVKILKKNIMMILKNMSIMNDTYKDATKRKVQDLKTLLIISMKTIVIEMSNIKDSEKALESSLKRQIANLKTVLKMMIKRKLHYGKWKNASGINLVKEALLLIRKRC